MNIFKEEHLLEQLSKKGDPLERLNAVIDGKAFGWLCKRSGKSRVKRLLKEVAHEWTMS
jgi:hypothetical protein